MLIVMGATGHVGGAVATALLEVGEPVTVIVRDVAKSDPWREQGAQVAVTDVGDIDALRAAFRRGRRAFLLNPPAPITTDTDDEEHQTAAAIVAALDGSGLEKVVAQSTYGAQPGERCGDLTSLYDFEQALFAQPIPVTVQRGAYYMSNWDALLEAAKGGTLPTMLPPDHPIPMVAPADLGRAAAALLREPADSTGIRYTEGPQRYAPADAAAAFAKALGRPVTLSVIPRDGWVDAYRQQGFSAAAAESYARMTEASIDTAMPNAADVTRGDTTLDAYIDALVSSSAASRS